nr:methyltransferase domain-containing protein [Sagittula salina]
MAAVHGWWQSASDKPWRFGAFQPALLQRAAAFGYMAWPERIAEHLDGRDVLDVGCGAGLHGLGYLAHGARSVLGIDPELRLDRDRVKNLATRRREGFGWTPKEIAARVAPWQVEATAIEHLETDRRFDLAVMHHVLAHVEDVSLALARVAALLRPGGRIVIRHKNFYAWNGHAQSPKTVAAIRPGDAAQQPLLDWGHLGWDAPQDHYIARRLNRVRLDAVLEAVSALFRIETQEEVQSTGETGLGRLTPEVRARFPTLGQRDFEVQALHLTAVLK